MKVFAAQFGILFGLGMIVIAAELWRKFPIVQQELQESAASLPPLWVIIFSAIIKNAVILAIPVSIGIICTRSLNLHSHLIDRLVFHKLSSIPFRQELIWSIGIGLIAAALMLLFDHLMQPYLPQSFKDVASAQPQDVLAGIFLGGIIEEIVMRWGIMSSFVWLGWKIFKQGVTLPSQWIYQMAIVLAAVIFGLGHLPATAALAPLTPSLIFRALIGNGIAGIAYGWLFWQYSLEAAMLAHACFHVFAFIVNKVTS
jgi:hypothetical protein